jgi:hypothetical protein
MPPRNVSTADTTKTDGLSKESNRLAYLISALCFLAIALTFAANANRYRHFAEQQLRSGWYRAVDGMLIRLRSYRERDAQFFAALIKESVLDRLGCDTDDGPKWHCTTLPSSVEMDKSDFGVFSFSYPYNDHQVVYQFERHVESAAIELASFARAGEIDRSAAYDVLKRELVPAYIASISSKEFTALIDIWNSKKWDAAPTWIAYGISNPPTTTGVSRVSYPRLDAFSLKPTLQVSYISSSLRYAESAKDMEQLLHKERSKAFESYLVSGQERQSWSLLGTGVQFDLFQSINAVVLSIVGLLVLFTTTMVVRKQRPGSHDWRPTLSFPDFGRFDGAEFWPPSLQAALCSGIWWAFLLLPIALTSTGACFRYVLYWGNLRPLDFTSLFILMGDDDFSLYFDFLNVMCLAVCLGCACALERLRPDSKIGHTYGMAAWSLLASFLLVFLFVRSIAALDNWMWYVAQGSVKVYAAFGIVWLAVLFYSALRGLIVLWIVAMIVVLSYAMMGSSSGV